MPSDQSRMFDPPLTVLKIFGVWEGRTPSKYYKTFSFLFLFVSWFFYNFLLTLNLVYTPRSVELFLREVIFYFTEITVTSKFLTVLLLRDKILEAFSVIDSDEFVGDYENKDGILYRTNKGYSFCWKVYNVLALIAYTCDIIMPVVIDLIRGTKSVLPICNYYFLSEDFRDSHFVILYLYQSIGMYGHMMYNLNMDSLAWGLLAVGIAQIKVLNKNFTDLKLSAEESKLPLEIQDNVQKTRLFKLLRHYEAILNFGALTTCVIMCSLLMPGTMVYRIFLVIYLLAMAGQIAVPGFFGTLLTHESEELVTAAYNCEWIERSQSFKRTLILFRERAGTPIIISGMKMFPLSLVTFVAIMKTTYSFFTLIRNAQET
ncbi:odorant receptor 59a-like [Helicoverpa zea]|uniref:odorant receptor 59a-like n=1 Tax=Helicoverpa zea TaxID=7113 RepID=UPI001F584E42|nr:odorant receptor 59a-like [Helicoverpa zea]